MHWVYYFGRFIIRVLLLTFARWRVVGKENLPGQGPYLIICNHLHIADPPIVAASIPFKLVFMAKEELFRRRWSRFWVQNFGAFPVRRDSFDRDSLRRAEAWLGQGVSVMMFPEGGRSRAARMKPAQPGAALLAARLGMPVLPVGITGTENFRRLGWCFFHHPPVTIRIGRPFVPAATAGRVNRERRQSLIRNMMKEIAALLPPEYRGVYAGGEDAES